MRATLLLPAFSLLALASAASLAACSGDDLTGVGVGETPGGNDAGPDDADVRPRPGDATVPPLRDSGADAKLDARPDVGPDTGPALPDAPSDAPSSMIVDATPDAVDAGAGDGAVADGSAPTGAPCTVIDQRQEQTCGTCGVQYRLCRAEADGGSPTWQEWGFCQREVAGGCQPGTSVNEACGRCGTRSLLCGNDCRPTPGFCVEPPTAVCSSGEIEFIPGLSCSAGEGRYHVCQGASAGTAACTYAQFSACVAGRPPRDVLTLPATATVGSIVAADFEISATTDLIKPIDVAITTNRIAACPRPLKTTTTRYSWVALKNESAQAATVSLWTSPASSTGAATSMDTQIAVYARQGIPFTDADRQACTGVANDTCTLAPCPTSGGFAGLTPQMTYDGGVAPNVTPVIPAGGTLIVYVGLSRFYSGAAPYKLNASVDALN